MDNVGFTKRHHTLFQMLGNFEFQSTQKDSRLNHIKKAYEFLTEVLQIPSERLRVSYINI